MDRPTGQIIRRHERQRPGELVHVDIKKLGNFPDGGGHRIMPRQQAIGNRQATTVARKGGSPVVGYSFIHTAIDDHSRLAYSEALTDERKETAYAYGLRRREARMLDLTDFGRNPHARQFGDFGVCYVRWGKVMKGAPPERRSALTVGPRDGVGGLDWTVEVLQQWTEEVRPAFGRADSPGPGPPNARPASGSPRSTPASPPTATHSGSTRAWTSTPCAAPISPTSSRTAGTRSSTLRQLALQAPAPVVARALGFHDKTTARIAASEGGSWNRDTTRVHALPCATDMRWP
ncbi:hypothetical protein HNR25_004802 [Streptomonospora salina]|uniref:Transposase n=1 Tax=Streptomonospora salina TaxID=104205 RepID=A0A841EIV6_9ACTN|nr:hypothetical protein [Streptomonospora salina]